MTIYSFWIIVQHTISLEENDQSTFILACVIFLQPFFKFVDGLCRTTASATSRKYSQNSCKGKYKTVITFCTRVIIYLINKFIDSYSKIYNKNV